MTEVAEQPVTAFPVTRTCPYAPPAAYAELREHEPVSQVTTPAGKQAWVVTRHQDVRTVLSDPSFTADRRHPNFPFLNPGQRAPGFNGKVSMISMDAPEHGRHRRAVLGEFTVRRMQALRPRIQEIVDECLDAMAAGPRPADLVGALALPVPSLVICELLGVPYSDHDFFQERTATLLNRTTPNEVRQQNFQELQDYLDQLVTSKERNPGEDLLSRQVLKQREDGFRDHDDLVAMAALLLIAGHETTANMISLGTLTLLRNPGQLAALREDPSRTPAAVEELLRLLTIVETVTSRVALTDIEVGGTLIRAGEPVIALGHTANHDPAAFTDPDTFDPDRSARTHVAFGYGPHQCLGQNLARMELQIVFDTLFARFPTLALAAPEESLQYKDDAVIYGMHSLPVTW
ncbi:cytochrome P450 [Crossiella equi]|uniref:Cytochrome P450 n=1 Tax=Crossiella equi TaxID=130796 RepID=A0ABS5ASM0_9PSEU|nr:cytochrome P450 [Crossiella equi]MBP2478675.1 cytochrome P450 [Crossiella equi]